MYINRRNCYFIEIKLFINYKSLLCSLTKPNCRIFINYQEMFIKYNPKFKTSNHLESNLKIYNKKFTFKYRRMRITSITNWYFSIEY